MCTMRWVVAALIAGLAPASVVEARALRLDREPGTPARLAVAAERAGLRPEVLRLALRAHVRATVQQLTSRPLLTVIDYSLGSREKRLWVLDLDRGTVLARELVAHGRNTGEDMAERFSNAPGSLQSSLGVFLTGDTYSGKHGLSLRLRGLENVNDKAEARAIVVHGADYVNDSIGRQLGRLGRSQGCPALSREAAPRIIRLIQRGTVLFAYHPSLRSELGGL
jgi:hypothetical protein